MTPSTTSLAIGKALGRVTSGLFIMTAVDDNATPVAVLVSWVQQAAFEPPSISLALTKDRGGARRHRKDETLHALAVLPQDDLSLMKKYARGTKPGENPFEGLELTKTAGGLPVPATAWRGWNVH